MLASLDEAKSVLSKWLSERSRIACSFTSSGVMVSVDGFIIVLNSESFVLAAADPRIASVAIVLTEAINCDYTESRRTPGGMMGDLSKEFKSCLKLKAKGFDCLLFELVN